MTCWLVDNQLLAIPVERHKAHWGHGDKCNMRHINPSRFANTSENSDQTFLDCYTTPSRVRQLAKAFPFPCEIGQDFKLAGT
jgi:hypothetical protein